MRRDYAGYLTKEMLLKSGITEITEDGRVFKGTRELKGIYNNQKKPYKQFIIYAFDENMNKIKIPSKTNSYNYRITTVAFHRAIYAWFYGEVPAGYVVDHKDNNPGNNNKDNLQLLTPAENLRKENVIKDAVYIPKMPVKKKYTKEYLDKMIAKWELEVEIAKKNHDNKRYRSAISSLAQWRRRKTLMEKDENEKL